MRWLFVSIEMMDESRGSMSGFSYQRESDRSSIEMVDAPGEEAGAEAGEQQED
jgi:hypothetical protein